MQRSSNNPLPLGRQVCVARRRAGLSTKELALKAGLSVAAVYNVERPDRSGRTRSLMKLAKALGLKLRIPDFATLAKDRGLTAAQLASVAQISFDTSRAILSNPVRGNLRSFEKVCAALGYSLALVF